MRIRYNLIIYSSSFTVLLVLLLALLLITPGDIIYQSVRNGQIANIFIVGALYLFTATIALFIYASRLYANRTLLASSPKTWIPIDANEIPHKVRHMILAAMARSAEVTFDARPKDTTFLPASSLNPSPAQPSTAAGPAQQEQPPVWGIISHPGYSAPSTNTNSSTPGSIPAHTSYETVILELPHLIEARAVSLLPSPPLPSDLLLIQRPSTTGLRDYLGHLSSLGLIDGRDQLCTSFLAGYERARFSGKATTEVEFRSLMDVFAKLLHSISAHGEEALRRLRLATANDDEDDDGLMGDDASLESRDEEGSFDTEIYA